MVVVARFAAAAGVFLAAVDNTMHHSSHNRH